MAKKKKTTKPKNSINYQTKNIFIAILFITLWIISLFSTQDSTAWMYADKFLKIIFWDYYKLIFSPIITLLWVWFLFKEWFSVNNWRIFWLFLFLLS